jgi:membrane dipeptidase
VNVIHPAVDLNSPEPYRDTIAWLEGWGRFLDTNRSYFVPVRSGGDLRETPRKGKIGVLLGMQNSDHFRWADDVRRFHSLGQRLSQLTYNGANRLGSGCLSRQDRGLTAFGAEVIAAMNACGMAVDVSHTGEQTTLDAFAASTQPVLITHANCKQLSRHPRCKSDRAIRMMARTGGVFGITCISAFLRTSGKATLNDALDHLEHVARVAGIEHVGLGTDLDVQPQQHQVVAGLNQPLHIFSITDGLLRRGFSKRNIEAVLGGNFQRALSSIFSQVV